MAGLNIVEKVIALEGVELLKNLTPEQLSRIASIAREVKYPPNKVILDPKTPVDALLVVVDGAVELSRNGEVLHTAGQNDVLGAWALFDDDPAPDTTSVYRPLLTGLYDVAAACKRILRVLAAAPDGAPLDRLLPKPPETAETEARRAMRRRSAWAGTLIAALELARQGDVALAQDGAFTRIHVRQADARAAAHDVPVAAGGERVPS